VLVHGHRHFRIFASALTILMVPRIVFMSRFAKPSVAPAEVAASVGPSRKSRTSARQVLAGQSAIEKAGGRNLLDNVA
jgi:hypothetical protein